jgi:hypothetical protein
MTTSWFPSFTPDAIRELQNLGVTAAQVRELQVGLVSVRAILVPPPANNETAELLGDIRKLASKLRRKLRELGTASNNGGQNSARQQVANLLAKGYWDLRPMDEGPTIIGAFDERLGSLAQAAKGAAETVPIAKPSRYKAASPKPVRIIDEALHRGWHNEHGAPAVWSRDQTEILAAIDNRLGKAKRAQAYPKNLEPSVSVTSAFRRIVGICYEAVGRNADPERAIKAYIANENAQRAHALKGFSAGVKIVKRSARTERPQKP